MPISISIRKSARITRRYIQLILKSCLEMFNENVLADKIICAIVISLFILILVKSLKTEAITGMAQMGFLF